MPSIVLDLQHDALDHNVPVSALLRKALVVARKLHLQEFQRWIETELAGYRGQDGAVCPPYRELPCVLKALNPFRGWIPVMFDDPELNQLLSTQYCPASIPELETLVKQAETASNTCHVSVDPELALKLMKMIGQNLPITFVVGCASLVAVLDSVRTAVLNWALKLEEDGITGEGLSFTENEKHKAQGAAYNVNNFFGAVEGLQLQQGTVSSVQVSFDLQAHRGDLQQLITEIRGQLPQSGISADDQAQAIADLTTIESQLSAPKPRSRIVVESLRSLRSVMESATGSGLYGLLPKLTELLGSVF